MPKPRAKKQKRELKEVAMVPNHVANNVTVRHTLSWSDDKLIIDIRKFKRIYDWEGKCYTNEFTPTKNGYAFLATEKFIEDEIKALKTVLQTVRECL